MRLFLPLFMFSIVIGLALYEGRYSFGIVEPEFKAGDCAAWTYEDEFESTTYTNLILKVGKTSYRTVLLHKNDDGTTTVGTYASAEKFKWFDALHTKVACPKLK